MIVKNLIVSIKDSGKGIKKENLERICETGYTTKASGEGTGLGLAISRKIIDKHNGTIIVDSTENKGSTFTIKIPVA